MGLESLNPFSDNRDDDAAKASVNNANAQNTQAYSNYDSANKGNMAQNNALAGQNYYGNAAQVYGQQQNAASMLQRQANGTAPSAAQIQMGTGLGQANQNAQAAALSQQGGVLSGNTQRNLLSTYGQTAGNVLGQTAALRAQEQASGQQAYSSALSGMQQQQQAQGQLNYNQGQNALGYNTAQNAQNYGNAQQTAAGNLQNTQNNITAQSQAAAAGMKNGMGALSAIGAGIATGGASTAVSGMLGGGGSSSISGMDPTTGALKGYTQNAQGEWNKTS